MVTFLFPYSKSLVVTNRGNENVIGGFVINKIILCFLTLMKFPSSVNLFYIITFLLELKHFLTTSTLVVTSNCTLVINLTCIVIYHNQTHFPETPIRKTFDTKDSRTLNPVPISYCTYFRWSQRQTINSNATC